MFTIFRFVRDMARALHRDALNRHRYGKDAPRFGEPVVVVPHDIEFLPLIPIGRRMSGAVLGGDWDRGGGRVVDVPKIAYCLRHWRDGLSWEESGAISFHLDAIRTNGEIDGCRDLASVMARLAQLDAIFVLARSSGTLKTALEAKGIAFRESGGILVHIDRAGRPLFGGGGHHRLAIALALGLPRITVQLGAVHEDALSLVPGLRRTTTS